MNDKKRSEDYFSELSEHRTGGDANRANAEATIFPHGEPVEVTAPYATPADREPAGPTEDGTTAPSGR